MTAGPAPWSMILDREDLEVEADWVRLVAWWTKRFGREPTVESALFVVGLHEQGAVVRDVRRDAKQDIIMEGTYRVLQAVGVYDRSGPDGAWERTAALPVLSSSDQEKLLRSGLILYVETVLSQTD